MARILFLSEACLLDERSSSARSIMAMLQSLADAGYDCHAVTMSLFEAGDKAALPADLAKEPWQTISFVQAGVAQTIYRTASRNILSVRDTEMAAFVRLALDEVRRIRPTIVLTLSSPALWPVLQYARLQGAKTVAYLAEANSADHAKLDIRQIDHFIAPTHALAGYVCEAKQISADRVMVIRDIVTPTTARPRLSERVARRGERYVTMVDPQPLKGGGFLLHLAAHALRRAPSLRFMVVESRWGRADWANGGARMGELDNVSWHPATDHLEAIFRHSAVLLMPSLNFETDGRIVIKALHSGVPILAMNHGPLAETMDGGGELFECPLELLANPFAEPSGFALESWLQRINALMSDDARYADAVERALEAGARAASQVRRKAAVAAFDRLLGDLHAPEAQRSDSNLRDIGWLPLPPLSDHGHETPRHSERRI